MSITVAFLQRKQKFDSLFLANQGFLKDFKKGGCLGPDMKKASGATFSSSLNPTSRRASEILDGL